MRQRVAIRFHSFSARQYPSSLFFGGSRIVGGARIVISTSERYRMVNSQDAGRIERLVGVGYAHGLFLAWVYVKMAAPPNTTPNATAIPSGIPVWLAAAPIAAPTPTARPLPNANSPHKIERHWQTRRLVHF